MNEQANEAGVHTGREDTADPLFRSDEANLVWDEYKYRHDLIWKHSIRSTVAVLALVTVPYSTAFATDALFVSCASILAIGYTAFTFFVVQRELQLLEPIRELHRRRQRTLFGFSQETRAGIPFSGRVKMYLAAMFVAAILAATVQAIHLLLKLVYKQLWHHFPPGMVSVCMDTSRC